MLIQPIDNLLTSKYTFIGMAKEIDTKLHILEKADALMHDVGYSNFSYADIASQLGIKNAAVHYHYPAKEDLGVAVIQRERRRFSKWIQRSIIREKSSWDKLEWFFSIYTHYMENGHKVCIPGSLASMYSIVPTSLQREAKGLVEDMLAWLQEMLEQGRTSKEFSFSANAEDKAAVIMGSIQGSLQLARITGGDQLTSTISQIKNDLRT